MDLKILILQILNEQEALTIIETQEKISVMDLLFKGGFMIIPILLLFIITIYIFIERILVINKESKSPKNFTNEIIKRVNNNDINGAKLICNDTNNPIARMILKGLNKIENSLKNIETSIENVGKIEIYNLEKNLSLLATISGAAPMLGFLGTVIGMIRAFISIAQEEGAVSPKLLSSGIYEAMISTAAGLFVGIIAYLAYNYLVSRVAKLIYRMEYSTIEFIETLQSKR
jgi:biopolymer transport protein ExbB